MADTNTTNLNLIKPEIGGAEDTWGVSINSDLDALDAIFSATGTEIDVRFNSANFDDNKKAIFGTGDDLQIYHDGSNSYIQDAGTGTLRILSDEVRIYNAAGNNIGAQFIQDGEARLKFNNLTRLATKTDGIELTGNINNTSGDFTLDIAGDILLDADGGEFKFLDGGTESLVIGKTSGSPYLYPTAQDSDLIFLGNDGGSQITALTLDMSDAGKATFNDAIVASGISQFSDVNIPDNNAIRFGNSQDLQIYHDGTHSYVANGTNTLYLRTASSVQIENSDGAEDLATFAVNGAATLFHDNSATLATTSTGVEITGTLDVDVISNASGTVHLNDTLYFQDNSKAVFGDSSDLQIYHDGSNSIVQEVGTGDLRLAGNVVRIRNSADTENMISAVQDGAVTLCFDGNGKLATTSTGVDVTGVLAVNSGTTDTAATFTSSDTAVAVNFVASDNSMQIATSSTDGIIKNNGAGSFRFFNNGSEAARINSSGLVGIGLTSPSSPLTIKSSATHSGGGLRIIQDSGTNLVASLFGGVNSGTRFGRLELSETSGDAINVRISADPGLSSYINAGNIGIGTTSPQGNLHVEGAAGASGGGIIYVTDADNGSTASDALHISKSGDTAFVYNRESSGDLQLGAGNTAGHVVIKSSGNVGIGTSSPSALLHLQSTGDTIARVTSADGNTALLDLGDVSDPDGGRIFYDSGSNLGFTTTSTERMRIDSSGNLAIGNTSAGAKLDVRQDSGTAFRCEDGSGGYFVVKHGGQTGIGTSSPANFLDVQQASSGSTVIYQFQNTSNTADSHSRLKIATGGTSAGDAILQFTNNTSNWYINPDTSDSYKLKIGTSISDSKLVVDTSGNIGIGTSSPSSHLTLHGNMRFNTTNADGNEQRALFNVGGSADPFSITGYKADATTVGMVLNSGGVSYLYGGNVGIGTASPSAPLHVVGHSFVQNGTLFTDAITSYSGSSLHLNAGSSNFRVTVNGSERARIDSSGNLLVGTTSSSLSNSSSATGINLIPNGASTFVRDGGTALYLNRLSSEGTIVEFRTNGASRGSIDTNTSSYLRLSSNNNLHLEQNGNSTTTSLNLTGTNFKPFDSNDNTLSLGTSGGRWTQLFAATSTIGTSDRNEKLNEAAISAAEKRVAIAAKGLLKKFKFKDAVTEKGSDARIHFGIVAQDLQDAFSAEGLDASDYGMWCSDTWIDKETGQEKTRLGIRYSELLAFIIAGM